MLGKDVSDLRYALTAAFWYAGRGLRAENPPPVVHRHPLRMDTSDSPASVVLRDTTPLPGAAASVDDTDSTYGDVAGNTG